MKRVLTVGVYDLLHIGHIKLFEKAKALGDHLIVAVQSDDFILKYKPEAIIVNHLPERLYQVGAIRFVDETVVYENVDEIVEKTDFDIFAIGPDQSHGGFQKAIAWCRQHGKEVTVIPRTEGISSTDIRHYIKLT